MFRKKKVQPAQPAVRPSVQPETPAAEFDPIAREIAEAKLRLARLERLDAALRPEPQPAARSVLETAEALEAQLREARKRAELAELKLKEQQAMARLRQAVAEAEAREKTALEALAQAQAGQQPPAA